MIETPRHHNLIAPFYPCAPVLGRRRDGYLPCRAYGQNARLRGVDNSSEALNGGVHAHVADSERAALVLFRFQFPIPGALAEVFNLGRDGGQTDGVCVSDNGRHQPDRGGDGDADVDGVVLADHDLPGGLAPGGVDGGDFEAGDRGGFDEEVVEGEFVCAVGGGVEGGAEFEEFGDGEGGGDEVVGVLGEGLDEPVGDGFAHRAGGGVGVGWACCGGGGGGGGGGLVLFDVGFCYAAAWASAFDGFYGDAFFEGEGFGRGAGVGLSVEACLEFTA